MFSLYRTDSVEWLWITGVGLTLGSLCSVALSTFPVQWTVALLVGLLGVCGIAVIGQVRRVLLAAICVDIPLQLDVYFGYNFLAGERGALAGLGVSVTTVSLVVLYGLWLADRSSGVRTVPSVSLRTSLPVALYLLFAVVSAGMARDLALSFYEIFLLLQLLLLYIYLVSFINSEADILFVLRMLLVGLALEGLIIIGIYLLGQNMKIPGLTASVADHYISEDSFRPGGTLGSPNIAAAYLSTLLGVAVSLWLAKPSALDRWLAGLACGAGGLALALTLSRGGWIAAGLSVSILCLAAWRRGWLPAQAPIFFAVAGVLIAGLLAGPIIDRLSGDDGGSAHSRIPLMKMAFRMIADSPVFGVGANNMAIRIDEYSGLTFLGRGKWRSVVHNNYLLIWVEKGIFGLLAFVWFLIATVRRGWRCWFAKDRTLSLIALGLATGITGHAVHMLADFFKHRPQVQLVWVMAGLITALHGVISARQASPQSNLKRAG